jgi:predicted amidohydrolase
MRISYIQDEIFWADKQANFVNVEAHLRGLRAKTDLVVLPEMFTTGFCTDRPELAECMTGETVGVLKRWAGEFDVALTGSFMATENGKLFNRAFFVFPTGAIEYADKRHLFSLGGEDLFFERGDTKLKVAYGGLNILILVCYDVRFPVWSRNVNNEYDLLVYVANFPEKRIGNWDVLVRARAIENQCFVCAVNRIGVDGLGIRYNGRSVLLDYLAQPILAAADDATEVMTAEIDTVKLRRFREKSAFWKDADGFELKM